MTVFKWIKAKLERRASSRKLDQRMRTMAAERETGSFDEPAARRSQSFEADYRAATLLLKNRMNESYPDNYHARLSSGGNNTYNHGERRAGAVDTASTAIAMALRTGATVQEAAEAGAVSVGI